MSTDTPHLTTADDTHEPRLGRRTAHLVQLVDPPRPLTGERLLMLAVLEDALQCASGVGHHPNDPSRRRRERNRQRDRRAALAWFFSADLAWPFSFLNICLRLDLDPARLRRRVARGPVLRRNYNKAARSAA